MSLFNVDLLIVSAVLPDFVRGFQYRGIDQRLSAKEIKIYIDMKLRNDFDWFVFDSDILRLYLSYGWNVQRLYGIENFMPFNAENISDVEKIAGFNTEGIRKIHDNYPNTIFLIHPTHWDYLGPKITCNAAIEKTRSQFHLSSG